MNIEKCAEVLGFQKNGSVYCKDVDDFHLTLLMTQTRFSPIVTCCYVLNRIVEADDVNHLKTELDYKRIRSEKNLLLVELNQLSQSFSLKEEIVDKTKTLINKIMESLTLLGYTNLKECIFCGNDEDVEYAVFNGLYLPLHNECHQKVIAKAGIELDNENKKVGRLPISILLAVVGAIVGLVPTFIGILVLQRVFALLFALIPICSFYGYKLGNAPLNKIMTITTIVSSIVVVVLFCFFEALILFQASDLPLNQYISEYGVYVLQDAGMNLLFLGLGFLVSWRVITNTKERQYNKLRK